MNNRCFCLVSPTYYTSDLLKKSSKVFLTDSCEALSPTTSLIIASYKLREGVPGNVTTQLDLVALALGAKARPSQSCKPSRASWKCLPFRSCRAPAMLCSKQNGPVSSSGSDFVTRAPRPHCLGSQVTQSPLREELLPRLEAVCWQAASQKRKPKSSFVVFADFCGINIPRAAGFKLPV